MTYRLVSIDELLRSVVAAAAEYSAASRFGPAREEWVDVQPIRPASSRS